jgi:hypothetical protein
MAEYTETVTTSIGLNGGADSIYQFESDLAIGDDIELIEEAKIILAALGFSDEVAIVNGVSTGLNIGQILVAVKSKAQDANLSIGQNILRTLMLGRTVTDALNLGQVIRAYKIPATGGAGSYGRIVGGGTYPPGFVPLAGAEDCSGLPCVGKQLVFSCPPNTLTIRLPSEHSKKLIFNKIDRYTIGKQLDNYQNSYPILKVLKYSFKNLNSTVKDNFIAFYKATAGLEMTLTDECNDQWFGVIITPVVTITQYAYNRIDILCPTDGGYYKLDFEFEAVKL